MRSLGRRLGVTDDELRHGDAADLVWQRLLARPEPWLLVIDNADEPAILAGAGSSVAEGRGWVRRPSAGSTGRVLITSRDHPNTLATRGNIASAMAEQGNHAAAEAEYRDVLAAQLRVLGPDHPAHEVDQQVGGVPGAAWPVTESAFRISF